MGAVDSRSQWAVGAMDSGGQLTAGVGIRSPWEVGGSRQQVSVDNGGSGLQGQ